MEESLPENEKDIEQPMGNEIWSSEVKTKSLED